MGRIRTIKPEFFRHEALFEAEKETGLPLRVAFAGLFTCADREGRFEWRPKQLKLDVLPWDECDFSRVLDALMTRQFIVKYTSEGREYGHIPSWRRHQALNNRERESELPDPSKCQIVTDASTTREPRDTAITEWKGNGKGREGEGSSAEFELNSPQVESSGQGVISIPLIDGSDFQIGQGDVTEWQEAFPVADVMGELQRMRVWCRDNPRKRKTKSGVRSFVTKWLGKVQDRGGPVVARQTGATPAVGGDGRVWRDVQ